MSRRLLALAGVAAFALLCAAGPAQAQDTAETTPAAAATQNPEADWTVVEYPEGREVVVELKPTALLPDARGAARVTRGGGGAAIALDVSGLGEAVGGYHLYAVGHDGRVVPLGSVSVNGGAGTFSANTDLIRFMLVLSPESGLTAVGSTTPVALRSAVPEGLAVVPRASEAPPEEAASNADTVPESMPDTAAAGAAGEDDQSEYDVPLLGVGSLRRGSETQLKSQPAGDG